MKTRHLFSGIILLSLYLISSAIQAQIPVWQGKGRIAISSDGNEHDHDDWAATPLTLALLAASGLQDNLALYTYSDHVWGSNQDHPTSKSGLNSYEHMRESALGGQKWFGFDKCIQIADQNGGDDYDGFKAPMEKFEWIKTSQARNNPAYKPGAWDWLYSKQETCIKENDFDPSDAGMIVYLLTGIEKTEPEMARKIMENPVRK